MADDGRRLVVGGGRGEWRVGSGEWGKGRGEVGTEPKRSQTKRNVNLPR